MTLLRRIGAWLNPPRGRRRESLLQTILGPSWSPASVKATASSNAYASTDASRKSLYDFRPGNPSAAVLSGSLPLLIAHCRQVERTTPLARAVSDGIVASVVGSGITLLPDTDDRDRDEALLQEFERWADHALADGGTLWDWQRMACRELVTAGAALARIVTLPDRLDRGWLPIAILPLEVEWLCCEQVATVAAGNTFVAGVELDRFGRPAAYHLRHPEALQGGERVPAEYVIHIYERRRAQQVRGEPILAAVVERALQDARLVETELSASVATAAPAVAITSEAGSHPTLSEGPDSDDEFVDVNPGTVVRLRPGESIATLQNNRPAQGIAPFRDQIRMDVASAARCSMWWLDRNPARANFSSMRMDQLLDRRSLAALKEAVGNGTAGRAYVAVLPYLSLAVGVKPGPQLERYDLRPDEPPYVDPLKEVSADALAIQFNMITLEELCARRGRNWQQVLEQRAREVAMARELNLPEALPKGSIQLDASKLDAAADANAAAQEGVA